MFFKLKTGTARCFALQAFFNICLKISKGKKRMVRHYHTLEFVSIHVYVYICDSIYLINGYHVRLYQSIF